MPDNLPVLRTGRQLSRSLDRLQAGASLEVARVRATEAVEMAKIEALGSTTMVALIETANLSAAEAFYASRVPHAAGRFAYIADTSAVGMADSLVRMSRKLK
jgi:hypothetical protein